MWLTTSVTNHFFDCFILFQFPLDCIPYAAAHNCFMIIFQILAFKRDRRIRLLGDEILRRSLLKLFIPLISLIPQNVKDAVSAKRSIIPIWDLPASPKSIMPGDSS